MTSQHGDLRIIMASASGRWEVVGRAKRNAGKGQSNHLTKRERKKLLDRMPRIEFKPPIQESATMYDVFLEKDDDDAKGVKENSVKEHSKPLTDISNKKTAQPRKKRVETEKKREKLSIEEAIAKISITNLEKILNKVQTSFPQNPDVWVKDLATYINLKLEIIPESDPVFKGKSKDFPLGNLNKACVKLLLMTLRHCSSLTMEHLFSHCIQSMLTEVSKSGSAYGYRMLIQLLVQEKPELVTSKLTQFMDLLKEHQNRPLRCLSILWCLGQAGLKDFHSGLRIWLEVMLSSVGFRTLSLASYPVDYLEILLNTHKNIQSVYGSISVREYFHMLDFVHNNGINIQADLKKKLRTLYPTLKAIAYGENLATTLRRFFPFYLSRLTATCSPAMKTELLTCLVLCLKTDQHCFSLWLQMYTKHLKQSGILMKHLLGNWEVLSRSFEKNVLHETLRSFAVTNDELVSKNKRDPAFATCKALLEKMNQPRLPLIFVVFVLIGIISGLVGFDLWSSPSIRASWTVRMLEEYGVLALAEQAGQRFLLYTNKAWDWIIHNIPYYYGEVYNNMYPIILQCQEFLSKMLDFVIVQHHELGTKLMQTWDWMYSLSTDIWIKAKIYVGFSWLQIKEFAFFLWQHVVHCFLICYTKLENILSNSNFFLDLLQHWLVIAVGGLQNLIEAAVQWCGNLLSATGLLVPNDH